MDCRSRRRRPRRRRCRGSQRRGNYNSRCRVSSALPVDGTFPTGTTQYEKLGFDNSVFFPVQPRLEGATYPVTDAPGLGIEINEDLVAKESFKFWEAPHLKRRDGSVTNW